MMMMMMMMRMYFDSIESNQTNRLRGGFGVGAPQPPVEMIKMKVYK